MKLLWKCILSPRLYKIYRDGPKDSLYEPKGCEKWGDIVITSANIIMTIGLYASPIISSFIYNRGFLTAGEASVLAQIFGGIGCVMILAYGVRGYGRANNEKYAQFVQDLNKSPLGDKKAYWDAIRKYDFEFHAWPVNYKDRQNPTPRCTWLTNPFSTSANENLPFYKRITIQILAFIATHTFALRLIYPGSVGLVQNMLGIVLLKGRAELVENHDGERAKLETIEGNSVDTMFVDRRAHSTQGKFLVVCSEGNSGFYEIGMMATPVIAGFSVLGWNHPGFGGSTGLPYPKQEKYAIDVVMQYAINELGFEPDHIIMLGWSIGGYPATWAAINYPVKGLILDATFDDLLPLAENFMPRSWALLVKEVIRSHLDLNIAEMLNKYEGPLHIVRRLEDEIICLKQGDLSSNRGNDLITKILHQRHRPLFQNPRMQTSLTKLLSAPLPPRQTDFKRSSPGNLEKPLNELIHIYMSDHRASHCSPLPEQFFLDIVEYLNINVE